MKEHLKKILILVISLQLIFSEKKEVKLLAIGNSLTLNAFEYVPFLEEVQKNIKLTIAGLYLTNSTIDAHYETIRDNKMYTYFLVRPGESKWSSTEKRIKEVLKEEKWDYITFHQVSLIYEDYSTYKNLQKLIDEVKSLIDYKPVFGWYMIPVRPKLYTQPTFSKEILKEKYEVLRGLTKRVLVDHSKDLKFVIPSGTAIYYNLMFDITLTDSSLNKVNFDYDGQHLREGIPKLILAYTVAQELFILSECKDANILNDKTPIDKYTYTKIGLGENTFGGPVNEKNRAIILSNIKRAINHPY